jgi:hypothetical protein
MKFYEATVVRRVVNRELLNAPNKRTAAKLAGEIEYSSSNEVLDEQVEVTVLRVRKDGTLAEEPSKPTKVQALLDAWVKVMEEREGDEGVLDDLVHDLVSEQASSINNGGFADQARYLVESLGLEAARVAIQNEFQEASQEVALPAE